MKWLFFLFLFVVTGLMFSIQNNHTPTNRSEMVLGGEEFQTKKEGIGAALKLGLGIKLFDKPNASYFYGVFGYKNAGYLEGEYLREGFFTRIGIMLIK